MTAYRVLFFVLLYLSSLAPASRAAESDPSYLEQLKIAERKVLRTRESGEALLLSANSNTLVSPSTISPLGRPYQVGDTWEVAAIRTESSMMRMTSDPRHLQNIKMQVGIFRYEVIRAGSTPQSEYTVRVTQVALPGFKPVDPRADALELQARPGTTQTIKRYFFRGTPNPVLVVPEGLHSAITPLELYPLDIPETLGAETKAPETFPKIPDELARAQAGSSQKVDLSRSVWFEQDDFFGRPVQMLWQKGDPWPAYVKTSNGISILIRKGNS